MPVLCTDGNQRSHKEFNSGGWETKYDNQNIDKMIDISNRQIYESENIPIDSLNERIKHVVQSCFNGKRLVVFSGGSSKNKESLLEEIKELYLGGASGSIIGRNSFQRPYLEALNLLNQIIEIYRGR